MFLKVKYVNVPSHIPHRSHYVFPKKAHLKFSYDTDKL